MSPCENDEAVERLARELCASEGWDPDERIACDPADAVRPQSTSAHECWCARWEPYASAARKMISVRDDDWDTF